MTMRAVNKKCANAKEKKTSKYMTRVLWSSDRDELFSPDDFMQAVEGSFSEVAETGSTCSWGFDEFEAKSVRRIGTSLGEIDQVLYEGEVKSSLSSELLEECQKWTKLFPFLRLRGQQLSVPSNSAASDISTEVLQLNLSDNSTEIVDSESSETFCDISMEAINDDGLSSHVEEIIIQDGNYEQNLSRLNRDNGKSDEDEEDNKSVKKETYSISCITEKVIDKLASEVWSELVTRRRSLDNRLHGFPENDCCLPPISSADGHNNLLSPKIPRNKGKTPLVSDFPKLEGILTVSPKVLSKRNSSRIGSGMSTRPNTGESLSQKPLIHVPVQPSLLPMKSGTMVKKLQDIKAAYPPQPKHVFGKGGDMFKIYLPALQENRNDQSILKGMQLDIGINDAELSQQKPREGGSFLLKPLNFLPPIDDRDTNFLSVVQDMQRPISFESHLPNDKSINHSNVYTRHLNNGWVRPCTSRTSRSITSSASRPHENAAQIKANKKVKGHLGHDIESMSTASSALRKRGTRNSENNLVTLFPIVTPLEPKQSSNKLKPQSPSQKSHVQSASSTNER